MLEAADGIDVVGEAENGEDALASVDEHQPDVLLLDVEMPELSGVEVAQQLQDEGHPVRLLALSSYDDQEYVQGLLANGAAGYLTKEKAPELIIEAVRAVADGEVRWFVQPSSSADNIPDFTHRETEVLQLMAEGHSNEGIADALHISESTVRKHATNVYQKLNVESAREAIAWAWQNGIMSREPGEDPDAYKARVDAAMMTIIESCSFQDLAGQRVSKVVSSLKHVESRVSRFAQTMGVADAEADEAETSEAERRKRLHLNGPAIGGPEKKQDEIDELLDSDLDQNAIDALFD